MTPYPPFSASARIRAVLFFDKSIEGMAPATVSDGCVKPGTPTVHFSFNYFLHSVNNNNERLNEKPGNRFRPKSNVTKGMSLESRSTTERSEFSSFGFPLSMPLLLPLKHAGKRETRIELWLTPSLGVESIDNHNLVHTMCTIAKASSVPYGGKTTSHSRKPG